MKVPDYIYEAMLPLNGDAYRSLVRALDRWSKDAAMGLLEVPVSPPEALILAQGRAQMLAQLAKVFAEAPERAHNLRNQR